MFRLNQKKYTSLETTIQVWSSSLVGGTAAVHVGGTWTRKSTRVQTWDAVASRDARAIKTRVNVVWRRRKKRKITFFLHTPYAYVCYYITNCVNGGGSWIKAQAIFKNRNAHAQRLCLRRLYHLRHWCECPCAGVSGVNTSLTNTVKTAVPLQEYQKTLVPENRKISFVWHKPGKYKNGRLDHSHPIIHRSDI